MPSYVALLTLKARSPKAQLDLAKAIRATGGCLSVWVTEGDPDVIATVSANDDAAAKARLEDFAAKNGATVAVRRALSEGEKEREIQGKLYV